MYPEEAKKLALQLLKGDIHSSWKIIHNLDQIGMNSCFIYDQVLRNAMYYIGDLWKNNEITVADEHLATGTADIILTRYLLEKKGIEPSKRALFFCIEGEEHVLGLKMVSSFFKEKGWDTQFLGANLPLEYAVYSAKKWKPSVIGISVSMVHHLPLLPNYIMELEKVNPNGMIMVGSRLNEQYDLRPYCSPHTLLYSSIQQIQSSFVEQFIFI